MKNLINVDSLTDIVSNSVGILIIFAVINLIHDNNKTYELEIPIEHETDLRPAYIISKDDRLLLLDTEQVFENAAQQASNGASAGKRIFELGYEGLFAQLDQDKGISFHARVTDNWPKFTELSKNGSDLQKQLDSIDPNQYFAYFFVYDETSLGSTAGSGYESFRTARNYLKARRIKSGWQPVNSEFPPSICDLSFSSNCRYLPSFLASDTGSP
ncbi:hypothetical protein [Leucothrix pacifica]|uniref:Uncharacterized protein n=1 Tax=Leucothrix pacifica TaxID=1247513 RepID=A0A317C2H7_9GAMM|nr:hypothetical protein [Leucothrix pacifica]PWQ92391.1 hypothetical protein DKW60_21485 [Leucothrix pacifica]